MAQIPQKNGDNFKIKKKKTDFFIYFYLNQIIILH
jgi:hypothetical protein